MRNRLDGIESLRAYAAVAVILFHLVWVGSASVPAALSFVGSHFGYGVQLFFVVSGFSLAYGYSGRLHSEAELGSYFLRRFARIAPLFYVVMVFQLVMLKVEHGATFAPLDVLLNALFVFNLVPHLVDGIVPASWTIGVEMMFYAAFPLLLFVCSSVVRTIAVLLITIAIATSFSIDMTPTLEKINEGFIYHNVVAQLPFFIWGMLVFHVYRTIAPRLSGARVRYAGWAICAVSIVSLCALYAYSPLYAFFWDRGMRSTWDALWGIPFGLLCLGMAIHPTRVISNLVTRYLGKVSFSLYLVHPHVLSKIAGLGLYRWVYAKFPENQGVAFGVCLVISLVVITAISAVTFRFIEQPGMSLGKRMSSSKTRASAPEVIPPASVTAGTAG